MKSYLDLIPISYDVHKKQNKMTLLCIIFAVFLITSIFSMAHIGVRIEKSRLIEKHGVQAVENLSKNSSFSQYYITAIFLFILVLIAGILMISSSINSNISQRTNFFGMLRCLGMTKKQIFHFVQLESINLCKKSIPIGILLGVFITWILSGILKFFVAGEFSEIPLFSISFIGIISGILMGFFSVFLSSLSPAKKASKISPISAVSENINNPVNKRFLNLKFLKIEKILAINHAFSKKKNFVLITSSFALSIILFLTFSVFIDFVGYIMPQNINTPDITIASSDGLNNINKNILKDIKDINGVKRVFGRKNILDISATYLDENLNNLDLIAFDNFDFESMKKEKQLTKNSDISKLYKNSNYVILSPNKENNLIIGDKIIINNKEVEIAGILNFNIFSNDGTPDENITLITSNETFTNLTGNEDFSLVLIQTEKNISEENIQKIKNLINDDYTFNDLREQRTTSTYIAFKLFIYGFLIIIALVSILNIMNSISLSVSVRTKEYGAMRAIGMSLKQINIMIIFEAFIYAIFGCIIGILLGFFISSKIFYILITKHFSYATWSINYISLSIILFFIFFSLVLAIYKPIKSMKNLSITKTINQL